MTDNVKDNNARKVQKLPQNQEEHSEFPEDFFHVEDLIQKSRSQKEQVGYVVNNAMFGFVITMITVFILFTDDVRVIRFNKDVDLGFGYFQWTAFLAFLLEVILTSVSKPSYFLSFFFWLDFIATASTIVDIVDIFVGLDTVMELMSGDSGGGGGDALGTTKASKASRLGRTTRIIRIIRLTRLIRIIKLQKEAMKMQGEEVTKVEEEDEDALVALECDWVNEDEFNVFDDEDSKESMVSKILTEATTKKVIVQILLILMCLPLFDILKIEDTNAQSSGLVLISVPLYVSGFSNEFIVSSINQNIDVYKSDYTDEGDQSIIQIKQQIEGLIDQEWKTNTIPHFNFEQNGESDLLDYLRSTEQTKDYEAFTESEKSCTTSSGAKVFQPSIDIDSIPAEYAANTMFKCQIFSDCIPKDCKIISYLYKREIEVLGSIFSISKTLLVCVLLVICNIYFTKDTKFQVLEPIDLMIENVKRIVYNPMKVVTEFEQKEVEKLRKKEEQLESNVKVEDNQNQEIDFLENKLFRFGRLLTLAQGQDGSEIIAKFGSDSSGQLGLNQPGEKVIGIFTQCEIVSFGDIVTALEEEVIVFTNILSYIIHRNIDAQNGIICKNMGDSQFFMWKIPFNEILVDQQNHSMKLINSFQVNNQVDMSLICLFKIYAEVNKSKEIDEQNNKNVKLKDYFDKERKGRKMEFKLDLKFGIHLGWAVEGVIGSTFKLDATQLSPHLALTQHMLNAAFYYNTRIVLSKDFHNYLSTEVKKEVRPIDVVKFPECESAITLQTCDCFLEDIVPGEKFISNQYKDKLESKVEIWELKNQLRQMLSDDEQKISDLFIKDPDLMLLRNAMCQEFQERQEEGFKKQVSGSWKEAKEHFDKCEEIIKHKDGPSNALMNFMAKTSQECDERWNQSRDQQLHFQKGFRG